MTVATALVAVASILLSAVAQLLLKIGMARLAGAAASGTEHLVQIATSPFVVGGLGLYGVGALMWLAVLARVPLSVAYPMVSLGFVFVAVLAWSVLGEVPSATRLAGIGLILVGVVLVGTS